MLFRNIMRELYLTNTLSRTKQLFKPVNEGHVGMYVCGPTVYGDAHLGHARPGVTYDVLFKAVNRSEITEFEERRGGMPR